MILTCPRCATRYLADDSQVWADGRIVRCEACGRQWRAYGTGVRPQAAASSPAPAAQDESLPGWQPSPGAVEPAQAVAAEPGPASAPEPDRPAESGAETTPEIHFESSGRASPPETAEPPPFAPLNIHAPEATAADERPPAAGEEAVADAEPAAAASADDAPFAAIRTRTRERARRQRVLGAWAPMALLVVGLGAFCALWFAMTHRDEVVRAMPGLASVLSASASAPPAAKPPPRPLAPVRRP